MPGRSVYRYTRAGQGQRVLRTTTDHHVGPSVRLVVEFPSVRRRAVALRHNKHPSLCLGWGRRTINVATYIDS